MANFFGKLFGKRTKDLKDIKIIFSDIDGTLYNRQGVLREETKKFTSALQKANVELILATGREHQVAEEALLALGMEAPIISLDGALVKDSKTGKVLYTHAIPDQKVRQIFSEIPNYNVAYTAITPEGNFYNEQADLPSHLQHPSVPSLKIQKAPLDKIVLRLYITGNKPHTTALYDALKAKNIVSSQDISHYESRRESGKWYVEIHPHKATKGIAVQHILEARGIKQSEVAGIGDYRNDVDLLKACGYRVAMADAVAEMRDIADFITTKTCDEGGIEEFFTMVLKAKRNGVS
ncbi:MAG: Cof-type HAD-IIB family hydrolase [Bacteroidota bacterium]